MKHNDSIKNVMSDEVITISKIGKFSEVKNLMRENNIHHIPVVDGKKVVGVLSAVDILKASYSSALVNEDAHAEKSLDHLISIEDLMETKVVTLKESDTVRHAAEIFSSNQFHALPIVNNQQELVGITTSQDIIAYLIKQY